MLQLMQQIHNSNDKDTKHFFGVLFTGRKYAVVYQEWQISDMHGQGTLLVYTATINQSVSQKKRKTQIPGEYFWSLLNKEWFKNIIFFHLALFNWGPTRRWIFILCKCPRSVFNTINTIKYYLNTILNTINTIYPVVKMFSF